MNRIVAFWIWLSVLASVAGWTLSACAQLNRAGYAIFAGLALIIWFVFQRRSGVPGREVSLRRIPKRRFRRFLPLSFAALAVLVLAGGLIYLPSNHTGLSYRVPRVLHWLAEGQWHWIHTANYRMNNRGCGMEWLSAPLLLFCKSDRALFLLNFLPFLMMPGLVFSVFTRLGVRARVAWRWMWLLPTGYSFLLQAGSIGNDAFPTLYALAALDFAFRARESRRTSDIFLSILAAAFMTGAKVSNLPLLLPWAIAMLGVWRLLLGRPLAASAVFVIAALASFLPTAILNFHYCGDWSGMVLERPGMNMKNPFVGLWGNALLLVSNNFVPPFFPMAGWYNESITALLPGFIIGPMSANFEESFLRLWELPTEDWIGLGFGVSMLVAISVVAAWRGGWRWHEPSGKTAIPSGWLRTGVLWGPWIALLAYAMKSGMVTPARLISPYYPLLIAPLLLLAGQTQTVRTRWWQIAEVAVLIIALGVLIVTPPRPLWPAQTILSRLAKEKPDNRLVKQAFSVYSVYSSRPDYLAEVRRLLPPDISVVGFIATGDDLDISLWRPYGTRKVEHFTLDDPVNKIRERGVEYVVVGGLNLAMEGRTLEGWLQETGGELMRTVTAIVKVREGPQPWYIIRIPHPPQ